jgi:putative ABC transport system permease protein
MPFGPIVRAMTRNKTRFVLIILEVAITLAVVTNCVQLILAQRESMQQQSGFDDDNIIWVRSRTFGEEFQQGEVIDATIAADLRALQAMPGVVSAANTNFLQWQGGGSSNVVLTAGGNPEGYRTQVYFTSKGVFDTLDAPVTEGRGFEDGDYAYVSQEDGNPAVVVVSRALAKLMWGDESPLGKVITNTDGSNPVRVVGVIEEFYNPYGWPIHEYVAFIPGSVGNARGASYLVRTESGAMDSFVAGFEKSLLAVNANRVFRTQTVLELRDQFFSGGRLLVKAMTAVIVVLVFVTALGIVGITSLSVSERTRQIGTRRALGATRGQIMQHFLLENWIVTTAGIALGLIAAFGLNVLLLNYMDDAKLEWTLVAVGTVLLWLTGIAATIPPALRGMRVSPAIATRSV